METRTSATSVSAIATSESSGALVHSSYYASSPLPPAAEVESLERIFPGAAKTLFEWAGKEQEARIERDKTEQENQYALAKEQIAAIKRGQFLAFFLILSSIALAVVCAFFKAEILGAAACGISGGLGYFLLRRKNS